MKIPCEDAQSYWARLVKTVAVASSRWRQPHDGLPAHRRPPPRYAPHPGALYPASLQTGHLVQLADDFTTGKRSKRTIQFAIRPPFCSPAA